MFEDPLVSETWALHAYTVSYSPSFRNYLNDGDESMGTSNSVRWRGKIVSKLRACCSSSASGCNNLCFLSFPTVSFSSKTYCHCFEGKQWTDAKHKPIRWWSTALSRLLTKFEGEKSSLLYACEHDLFTIAPWLPLAEMDAGSVCDSIMRSVDTVRWRMDVYGKTFVVIVVFVYPSSSTPPADPTNITRRFHPRIDAYVN